MICLREDILKKYQIFAERRRIFPYFLDALYTFVSSIGISAIVCICFLPIAWFASKDLKFSCLLLLSLNSVFPLVIGGISALLNLVVPLYCLDLLFGKKTLTRKVELRIILVQITLVKFMEKDISYLPRFFDNWPVPCYYMYFILPDNHMAKSSEVKKPPRFYRGKTGFHDKEKKSFRFIMTKEKSKAIDKLFRLEPTAEFEITYLCFSRFLKEIRPIEGYEYAEGVPEILEQINAMYP